MYAKIVLLVFRLFALFPLPLSQAIGGAFGWIISVVPNQERRIARINIENCLPELSPLEQKTLLRSSLIESAKTVVEMPGVWAGGSTRWINLVQSGRGENLFNETLAIGKGVIAVGPHLGNWEVGLHYLTSLSPVTATYRPPRQAFLDDLIRGGRSKGGASMVPATPHGVKMLLAALKRGEMMALLADQQPKAAGKQGGVFVPFFGQHALTMVLVGRLARKTGASVLFWYMERLPDAKGFRIHWYPAPTGIDDPDPVVAATALNQGLEECIRSCPAQYTWSYKRFAAQPEGLKSLYRRSSKTA